MAQTFSTAREPSMEEILASIRRIIEDSDVAKQVGADLTAPLNDQPAEPRPVAQTTAEPFEKRGEIAQFRRPATVEAEQGAEPAPLNLQAVLRGSLPDNAADQPKNHPDTQLHSHERNGANMRLAAVQPSMPTVPSIPPVPPVVVAAAPMAETKPVKASELLMMQIAGQRNAAQIHAESGQKEDPVAEPQQNTAANTADHNSAAAVEKPLISQAAEAQVAASFGTLSQALLEEQKRLLDQKMETMLRPMLQHWLDTNLPPLVERLVREEIERVVRRG